MSSRAAPSGWNLLRDRYEDGGFSGGSMERPALQKLLADVSARKIDVIVYKLDRLTRSLADFAKLVELFDAHGVSFISVTHAFNTTTSRRWRYYVSRAALTGRGQEVGSVVRVPAPHIERQVVDAARTHLNPLLIGGAGQSIGSS